MRTSMSIRFAPWILALLLVGFVSAEAIAQTHMVGPRLAPRPQLEGMLDSLRAELETARDRDRRERLRLDVAALEHRLRNGDLYPRDVISLRVEGEEAWTDQFPIGTDRELELPRLDPIPLEGVLYSELEGYLRDRLGRYLRNPRIRAEPLKRVAILGQVGSPGYYNLPGSVVIADAIMEAGGPTRDADPTKTQIRSWGTRVARDRPNLPAQGVSLDHLGVNSGDEIWVPERRRFNIRTVAWGLGATATFIGLMTRIF